MLQRTNLGNVGVGWDAPVGASFNADRVGIGEAALEDHRSKAFDPAQKDCAVAAAAEALRVGYPRLQRLQ